ncbi:MAG: hypothetical protein ACRCTE_12105 [Cellulosilyticaceae bacterium]
MEKTIISQHIFMFPFSWQMDKSSANYLLTQHKEINKKQLKHLENWEPHVFSLGTDKEYNEFVYFYKPVRPVLYTLENMPHLVLNYRHKWLGQEAQTLVLCVNGREYTLQLEQVHLKLYKTGIGIVSFYIDNTRYDAKEDLLSINGMSRCIYPQVLPLVAAKQSYHPDWIRIYDKEHCVIEDLFHQDYRKLPICISQFMMHVLGNDFAQGQIKRQGKMTIEPLLGGQMFTLCMLNHDLWRGDLGEEKQIELLLGELMLVTEEEKRLCEYGNISYLNQKRKVYGMSKSAFACISHDGVDGRLYDQLVTLALVQRVTLLHFSSEIATISTLPKHQLVAGIQSVYEIYIQFINQMYFTEITLDLEGTQIYQLLTSKLRIQEELRQLDFEMQEIHEYAALVDQSQARFKMDMATVIGAALVIPTFVTGFFGMNIMQDKFLDWWHHKEIALWMNAYVFLPVAVISLAYFWTKKRSRLYVMQRVLLLLVLLGSLFVLWHYGCGIHADLESSVFKLI